MSKKKSDNKPENPSKVTSEIFRGKSEAQVFALMTKYPHLAREHFTTIGLLTKSGNIAKPYQNLFQ